MVAPKLLTRLIAGGLVVLSLLPRFAISEGIELGEQQAIQNAMQRVAPFVVQIQTIGGQETVEGQLVNQAPTSGIIVSDDGYILSSAINFAQQPASILVQLPDARRYPARIVARDQLRMLILLKIDVEEPLGRLEIVPRDDIHAGQWALAIGRSLDVASLNVSVGIVSATNRIWGRAIQTDAKVSPLNYGGPLVDIHGHVMGILVPLSPDSDSVAAGTELYDSGIGFAIPLSDLVPDQLERMKSGQDLKPGLLGVHLKGQNIYTEPAVIGFCSPKSPAREVGLLTNDEIIEVDGQAVSRQVHMRHAMGRKSAGDTISLRIRRGDQILPFTTVLAATIEPYVLPFLGVLPSRTEEAQQHTIAAYIYPQSPAATSELQVGDALQSINGQEIQSPAEWREALGQLEPGTTISIGLRRGSQTLHADVTLTASPGGVPAEVPPRHQSTEQPPKAERTKGHWTELRLADEPNLCLIREPVDGDAPLGLIVWLAPPGKLESSSLEKVWGRACDDRGFVLAVPRPREESTWEFGELETIRRLLESILAKNDIDSRRVVVGGDQVGGSLAAAYAFLNRERVRGVVMMDATLPRRILPRGNDPESRLEFLLLPFRNSSNASLMKRNGEQLREIHFPVVEQSRESDASPLDAQLAELIIRWSDTLDRL